MKYKNKELVEKYKKSFKKPRSPKRATIVHKDKTKYTRKIKHRGLDVEN